MTRRDSMTGCLLGTALGDAVGLACEGLPPKRQAQLFPALNGPRLLARNIFFAAVVLAHGFRRLLPPY